MKFKSKSGCALVLVPCAARASHHTRCLGTSCIPLHYWVLQWKILKKVSQPRSCGCRELAAQLVEGGGEYSLGSCRWCLLASYSHSYTLSASFLDPQLSSIVVQSRRGDIMRSS